MWVTNFQTKTFAIIEKFLYNYIIIISQMGFFISLVSPFKIIVLKLIFFWISFFPVMTKIKVFFIIEVWEVEGMRLDSWSNHLKIFLSLHRQELNILRIPSQCMFVKIIFDIYNYKKKSIIIRVYRYRANEMNSLS